MAFQDLKIYEKLGGLIYDHTVPVSSLHKGMPLKLIKNKYFYMVRFMFYAAH